MSENFVFLPTSTALCVRENRQPEDILPIKTVVAASCYGDAFFSWADKLFVLYGKTAEVKQRNGRKT